MKKKLRMLYIISFFALFLIEVLIALFVRDQFIRPYVGDVLVTMLICCFVRMFLPEGVRGLPIYVMLFAAAVEIGQYFQLVKLLGLGNSKFFSILLGTSFSVYDLLCYAVGCAVFFVAEKMILRRLK